MNDKKWNISIKYRPVSDEWTLRFGDDAPDKYDSLGLLLDDLEYTLEDGIADGSEE